MSLLLLTIYIKKKKKKKTKKKKKKKLKKKKRKKGPVNFSQGWQIPQGEQRASERATTWLTLAARSMPKFNFKAFTRYRHGGGVGGG